jgi:hypothetical protein
VRRCAAGTGHLGDTADVDEDVPGRGPTPPGVPDAAAIRRALGECMTLADIDDAMDWPEGTARRRRWRDPATGGLPPADAELGGVPLWFRATISRWRAGTAGAPPDAGKQPAGDDGAPSGPRSEPAGGAPAHQPEVHPEDGPGTGTRSEPPPEPPSEPRSVPEAEPLAESAAEVETESASEGEGEGEGEGGESATAPPLRSGFQLDEGQDVLAHVHGSWQPAVVRSRARRTVVVDYQVHPGALGARRQRVAIDRIRLTR